MPIIKHNPIQKLPRANDLVSLPRPSTEEGVFFVSSVRGLLGTPIRPYLNMSLARREKILSARDRDEGGAWNDILQGTHPSMEVALKDVVFQDGLGLGSKRRELEITTVQGNVYNSLYDIVIAPFVPDTAIRAEEGQIFRPFSRLVITEEGEEARLSDAKYRVTPATPTPSFQAIPAIVLTSGTHDGPDNSPNLIDSPGGFTVLDLEGGDHVLHNKTDGSKGKIDPDNDIVDDDTLSTTLSGGTENDWDIGDLYEITLEPGTSDPEDLINNIKLLEISIATGGIYTVELELTDDLANTTIVKMFTYIGAPGQ